MPAQQMATGAIHVFVRAGSESMASYFGTCERFPEDTRQPEYEALMNDYSGSKVPLDFSWEGESAQISLSMTRWDEVVAQDLEDKPFSATSIPGSWSANDVGTLMGLEFGFWELSLVRTFGAAIANKGAFVNNGLLPVRRYRQCVVWTPESDQGGTQPMKRQFLFYAWPLYIAKTRTFVLYDSLLPSGFNVNRIF